VLALGIAYSVLKRPPLPVLGTLPPFALRSATGEAVSRTTLAGKAWIADFIFTRCAGSCPVMTSKMASLQPALPKGVLLVSFTVDPEHDTPEVLLSYARKVGAGPGWLFVTGEKKALYSLSTDGFKLAAMEAPPGDSPDGPFLHSSRLVLVDGESRIRGYYDTEEAGTLQKLEDDLGRLPGGRP
jgi:cytochrome oxidase Cu insertion factor (SCO1/SenC/PrrC family)